MRASKLKPRASKLKHGHADVGLVGLFDGLDEKEYAIKAIHAIAFLE